jgi:hypothetical protein
MVPKGQGLPKLADDSTLNMIRGKAMVGHQSIEDVWTLIDHISLLETMLDEEIDPNDGLGTDGWRNFADSYQLKFRR